MPCCGFSSSFSRPWKRPSPLPRGMSLQKSSLFAVDIKLPSASTPNFSTLNMCLRNWQIQPRITKPRSSTQKRRSESEKVTRRVTSPNTRRSRSPNSSTLPTPLPSLVHTTSSVSNRNRLGTLQWLLWIDWRKPPTKFGHAVRI